VIRINGLAYCSVCVKDHNLGTKNPNGTDLVENDNRLYPHTIKCSMPGCYNALKPKKRKWTIIPSLSKRILDEMIEYTPNV
jgi:hypothetical protein